MAQATGANLRVILAKETSYGVLPVTPNFRQLNMVGVGENSTTQSNEAVSTILNGSPVQTGVRVTTRTATLSFPFEATINGIGVVLYAALGDVVTTGPDLNGKYTHVIKPGATLSSYTGEKGFPDAGPTYFSKPGSIANTLNLNFTPESLLTGDVSFVSQDTIADTDTLEDTPVVFADPTTFAATDLTIHTADGVDICLSNFSLALNNNVQSRFCAGSEVAEYAQRGITEVTGSFTVPFEDATYFTKAKTDDVVPLVLKFTVGNESLQISLPYTKLSGDYEAKADNTSLLNQTFNFRSTKDPVSGTSIIVTLVNGEETIDD